MYFKQCHSDDNMLSVLIFESRPTVLFPDLHYEVLKKFEKVLLENKITVYIFMF